VCRHENIRFRLFPYVLRFRHFKMKRKQVILADDTFVNRDI
jgi:hypothetical protein